MNSFRMDANHSYLHINFVSYHFDKSYKIYKFFMFQCQSKHLKVHSKKDLWIYLVAEIDIDTKTLDPLNAK